MNDEDDLFEECYDQDYDDDNQAECHQAEFDSEGEFEEDEDDVE